MEKAVNKIAPSDDIVKNDSKDLDALLEAVEEDFFQFSVEDIAFTAEEYRNIC